MIQPSPEQLQRLHWIERWTYHLSDWCNRWIKLPFMYWNAAFMYALIWVGLSRRLTVKGMDNIKHLTPNDAVLIASNHRTFFDFFVITWINFDRTTLSRRIFFPVRSNFFYDNFIGWFINFFMGGCAMFPPIFRDEAKKEFNKYSISRIMYELKQGSATIGFHPEGRRNRNSDPYSFLPAKAGIGHIAVECPKVPVIPVFIVGMTNNYAREVYRNWFKPTEFPITVYYGTTMYWNQPIEPQQIADDTLKQIEGLATTHRNNLDK